MNRSKKLCLVLLALTLCVSLIAIPVCAASVQTQGEIEVALSTDKTEYEKTENIIATLVVKNNGDTPISNVSMKTNLIEGYLLAEDSSDVKSVELVEAGTETALETVMVPEIPQEPPVEEIPETKDSLVGLWVVVAMVSVAGISVLLITDKNAKKSVMMLVCVLMAGVMMFGLVSPAAAAVARQTIEVDTVITVGGEEVTVTAVVTYEYEVPVEPATIKGTIAYADNREKFIENAKVEIISVADPEQVVTVYSDANGAYSAVLPGGAYTVRISAEGFLPFTSLESVEDGQTIYLETYLLVEANPEDNESATIGGQITNSVTGVGIPEVQLTIYEGWNVTSGEPVATAQTDSTGNYTVELPLGNYTICMEREGFVPGHFNVAVPKGGNNSCHGVMTPNADSTMELGDMRIILTWGQYPSDLDSHLWGPTVDGEDMYHIYWRNESYDEDDEIMSFLDVDDISSYGPETTTVYDMTANGMYSFYVHDFTNRSSTSSTAMANSGAKVQVYMGEELIAQYHVPTSGVGSVWHVFDFDAVTGTIVSVNEFFNCSDSGSVGSPSAMLSLELDDKAE